MSTVADRKVPVWQAKINANIKVAGSGPPVVFLHGAGGLLWDEFLEKLAARHTVYAPELPGTSEGDPDAISHLDNLWDLVLYNYEVLDGLDLRAVPIIGHSFGAMLAAELAASNPERVSKLVLIAPIGLWREDTPVANWMAVTPASDMVKLLLHEPEGPLAQKMFGVPDTDAQIKMIWSMACSGKFVWPIPDKGLKKRIHRIQAPTLILWGKQDRLISSVYAQEFASRIAGSRVELIDQSGHLPTAEHPDRVVGLIEDFLGA
ncbi:MAG: alpha/beta hydrolase [Terriglobia bacterium]|nr:MAG: alpha/beta hydrolase [Terriglobia bacterium]